MLAWKIRAVARNLALAVAVVLLVLGSSAVTALEGEPSGEGLFAASAMRGSINRAGEPAVIRSRYVELNLGLLFGPDGAPRDLAAGSALTLNFFEDTALVVLLDRMEPAYGGGFTWVGQVQDEPLSLVTLSMTDGVMAGTVLLPGSVFEIGYAGNGVHVVSEIDQSAFPPDADPLLAELPVDGSAGAVSAADPAATADDGSTIDVMVVYTPKARQYQGGTTAMQTLINSAISQTNTTYANSAINQRLHLVHAAEVSYVESGDIVTDLTRLRNLDGYMDNVHTLRDTYHADEVALIVEYPSDYWYCGVAYLLDTLSTSWAPYAFAAIERNCTTGNLSFAHELGHNMGAHHDWYVNASTELFSYSHGKVNTYDRWYTIMSYYTECSDRGVSCTRLPYWSNPYKYYGGDPMGVPGGTSTSCRTGVFDPYCDADNHRTLNESAWTVANFRLGGTPPSAPTGLTATPVLPWNINLSWTDTSNDEAGFRIQRSLNGSTWSTLATVAVNTTSYPDTSATPGTLYYYRVIAFNTYGDSAPSNTAIATLPVVAGPLEYDGLVVDDDNLWGTSGDNDGYIDCGETVGLTVMLANAGNTAVTGIDTTLSIFNVPGDVPWTGDLTSLYPSIAGGASAGNLDAFQFSIKPDAEHGHRIDFELAIDADNWSGSAEFSLPILCATTANYRQYLPLIFKD